MKRQSIVELENISPCFLSDQKLESIVEHLLSTVPEQYLHGIKNIKLRGKEHSNIERINIDNSMVKLSNCQGRYVAKDAEIILYVDNMLKNWTKARWSAYAADMVFSETLYYGIGRHITELNPQDGDPIATAKEWRHKLFEIHYKKKHAILYVLIKLRNSLVREKEA